MQIGLIQLGRVELFTSVSRLLDLRNVKRPGYAL